MNTKTCKSCGDTFAPSRNMQSVCSPRCALELLQAKREQRWKQETRKKKKELKSKTDFVREAQAAFNRWVRKRDEHLPCISCGRMHKGQWHAGHYRTTAAAPQLRFDESNVHKQCAPCNSHKSGDIVNYRMSLIERIGEDEVARLEHDNTSRRWTVEELEQIKKTYNAKYREML